MSRRGFGGYGQRQDGPPPENRLAALKRKLAEIEAVMDEEKVDVQMEEAAVDNRRPIVFGPTERQVVRFSDQRGEIVVTIGTSKDVELADRIADIVHKAYTSAGKSKRVDREDALDRLEMGDEGIRANRVLHMAWLGDTLAGVASSTFSPGWTPEGCGHWGLLAVDPALQGKGVASALILAAERRLATVSEAIQIEYRYTEGDPFSGRLMQWYEDSLGFEGGPRPKRPGETCFRRCFKEIPADDQRKGQRRRLHEIRDWLAKEVTAEEQTSLTAL